jgi:hypothetical protein
MKLVNLDFSKQYTFGPTKFKMQNDDDLRVEFLTKVVTDLGITFQQLKTDNCSKH